jgi:hypothetical protein
MCGDENALLKKDLTVCTKCYILYILEVEMMHQQIPVSQARARLSELLKKLQENPEIVFEITVNGMVLGELRSAKPQLRLIQPGEALAQALAALGAPEVPNDGSVARQHDEYLYTKT